MEEGGQRRGATAAVAVCRVDGPGDEGELLWYGRERARWLRVCNGSVVSKRARRVGWWCAGEGDGS